MSRVTIKNMPRLRLSDLLRRRKMTLETFIKDSGVQTYEALSIRCSRLGVQPPPREEYEALRPETVSSPSDGVVVLDPPDVIEESTGRKIDPDAPVTEPGVEVVTEPKAEKAKPAAKKTSQRGRRRKKVETPTPDGE